MTRTSRGEPSPFGPFADRSYVSGYKYWDYPELFFLRNFPRNRYGMKQFIQSR